MTICLVTDRRQLSPDARTARDEVWEVARWLDEAVAAGIDLIQVRERDLPARELVELGRAVRTAAAGSATRVVVNDRADVGVACGCDGVHLRGDGPPVARVRALAACSGLTWTIGRSVHTAQEARLHAAADYLLFGAVFDSGPKPGLGLDALRAAVTAYSVGRRAPTAGRGVSRASGLGVLAIGGLTVSRAAACVEAGAAGVAAIRLFLPPGRAEGALGVSEAVRQLRGAFDDAAMGHLQ